MDPRTPLIRPRSYFGARPNSISTAIGVFALYLVGSIGMLYAVTNLLLERTRGLPRGGESAVFSAITTTNLLFVLRSIVLLVLIAAVIHFLSGWDETDGTYGDALSIAGWSFAPEILALPIDFAISWYSLQDRRIVVSDDAVGSATREAEALGATIEPVAFLLAAIVAVWTMYIIMDGAAAT